MIKICLLEALAKDDQDLFDCDGEALAKDDGETNSGGQAGMKDSEDTYYSGGEDEQDKICLIVMQNMMQMPKEKKKIILIVNAQNPKEKEMIKRQLKNKTK